MFDRDRPKRYRTIFLSDFHLGTRGCQANLLLDFLRHADADTIYLVGDIVDGWELRRSWYWPQAHNDVVQKLLRKARKGTRIVLVPGNHDEFLRDYPGTHFGGVEVVDTIVHEGANGQKLLVLHGDQFDIIIRHAPWLSRLGDRAYRLAMRINAVVNFARRRLGFSYWSLSAWAKLKVKNYVSLIGAFEQSLVMEARKHGADGVVCGHIHHAALHDRLGIRYVNTGDWVESCTAVVEHFDGSLEILRWTEPARIGEPQLVPAELAA
jgi:UDP-2,3-diacylglucosamine pyrophosphatase LpxH